MVHVPAVRVDPDCRQVWYGATEVRLTRKAFDLLAVLIERRPSVVSKEDIRARLWPDTFVSEITLHSLVSELRRALGDEAGSPRFIRTAHGLGYAFIGPVEFAHRGSPEAPRHSRGWLVGDAGRLPLFDGENLLGRDMEGATEVPSSTVSRRHATIRIDEDVWLEDLGSKNGTFVGDSRVTRPVRLCDGDRVRLGSVLFTFRVAREVGAASTLTASGDRSDRECREPLSGRPSDTGT